jgi:SOS response regulatory protein OraA/RecX
MNYTYSDAMERALKYVHLRPKTQMEITAFLREKGHDDEIIQTVIQKLTTLRYA